MLFCTETQSYTTAFNKYRLLALAGSSYTLEEFQVLLHLVLLLLRCTEAPWSHCSHAGIHLIPPKVKQMSQVAARSSSSEIPLLYARCQETVPSCAEAFWLLFDVAMIFPAPLFKSMGSAQFLSLFQAGEHIFPPPEPAVASGIIY